MKMKKFLKKVIKETDKLLEKHNTLDIDDFILYENEDDRPIVEIEDVRGTNEITERTDMTVCVNLFYVTEDVKGAAKEVIKQIEQYVNENNRPMREDLEYEEEEDFEYDDEEEDFEYEEEEELPFH